MHRLMIALLAAMVCGSTWAQTPAIGQSLYASLCTSCHASNPTQDRQARNAANNPSLLANAINSVGQMGFLASRVTATDRSDIAAYIGNPSAVPATARTDNERVFNWAEWKYQTLLLPRTASQTIAPYSVRFYSQLNFYVGIANGRVYTYQPTTAAAQITDIGTVAYWLGQASADGF